MRASIICYLVSASAVPFLNVEASLAEELSVEDRGVHHLSASARSIDKERARSISGMQCHKGLEHAFPISQAVQQYGQDR